MRSACLLCVLLVAGPAAAAARARAELKDKDGKPVGVVVLEQTPQGVLMKGELVGLPPGLHAIHVHEVGTCTPPFESAGGHFNPMMKKHGAKQPGGMHAGDLPNLDVPATGLLKFEVLAKDFSVVPGTATLFDADGAALVVHARGDDHETDPAGNAGDRIACGVIRK